MSRKYNLFIYRNASPYQNASVKELRFIENDLEVLGVNVENYAPPPQTNLKFYCKSNGFRHNIMEGTELAFGTRNCLSTGSLVNCRVSMSSSLPIFMSMSQVQVRLRQ